MGIDSEEWVSDTLALALHTTPILDMNVDELDELALYSAVVDDCLIIDEIGAGDPVAEHC